MRVLAAGLEHLPDYGVVRAIRSEKGRRNLKIGEWYSVPLDLRKLWYSIEKAGHRGVTVARFEEEPLWLKNGEETVWDRQNNRSLGSLEYVKRVTTRAYGSGKGRTSVAMALTTHSSNGGPGLILEASSNTSLTALRATSWLVAGRSIVQASMAGLRCSREGAGQHTFARREDERHLLPRTKGTCGSCCAELCDTFLASKSKDARGYTTKQEKG